MTLGDSSLPIAAAPAASQSPMFVFLFIVRSMKSLVWAVWYISVALCFGCLGDLESIKSPGSHHWKVPGASGTPGQHLVSGIRLANLFARVCAKARSQDGNT